MTREEPGAEDHEADASRRFQFDPSLIATLQCDVDAATAAGDRLAASADPDAVPLPVVRLASTIGDGERQ